MANVTGFTGIAWLGSNPWAYPALEAVHVVGIALLVGNLVALELRVWGMVAELPLAALARLSIGLSLLGFAIVAMSGTLMFAAQPNELLANRAFLLKLGLISLAGVNAAWFHARGSLRNPDRMARFQTVVSLGLWLTVIICGRWIAYA